MISLFGKTIQLYVTQACEMGCPHCSSVLQKMPNMNSATLQTIIEVLNNNRVERVELFANDPILHPQIERFVIMLNNSNLRYAILTVGDSPKNPDVRKRFQRVLKLVDPEKGAFVFSVDYTQDSARRILRVNSGDTSYAFKAITFWDMAVLELQRRRMPVRTNTVISRHNIDEVAKTIRRVAELGFTTSFCFAQHQSPEFSKLLEQGLTPEAEQSFRRYMQESALLNAFQIDGIVLQARKIVASGQLWYRRLFNAFRGNNPEEGDIEPEKLALLRQELLSLSAEFGDRVLPRREFIERLGSQGFGCLQLLKQGQFPQLKIGSEGQMIFCCDLHDPRTQHYHITDLRGPDKRESFLDMIRKNPYVWICACFNPCDFSVNHVTYETGVNVTC